MSAFSPQVTELLSECGRAGLSTAERGRALEELIARVFESVPGVRTFARNAKSVFRNEELDLVMGNRQRDDGLPMPESFFSVECKNWSRPVGAIEIAWFATKLRRSGQRFGVLVAASGVTGRRDDLSAAHFEVATALHEGQAIVVLTLAELEWLQTGEQLATLLREKHATLVARREILLPDPPPGGTVAGPVPTIDDERHALLSEIVTELEREPTRLRAVSTALSRYHDALDSFLASDVSEPSLGPVDNTAFATWAEANMDAFEALEAAVRRLALSAVTRLRLQRTRSWTLSELERCVDHLAPQHLWEPPDSGLATAQLKHWGEVLEQVSEWQHNTALLSILGWALQTGVAMRTDGWPTPSV